MTSLLTQPQIEVSVPNPSASGTWYSNVPGGSTGGLSTGDDDKPATKMVDVCGGMVLEVAKGKVRVVEQFNDPGPSGEGNTVGNIGVAFEEVFERLEGGGWGE